MNLDDTLQLNIIGGSVALSRDMDMQKLNALMQELQALGGLVGQEQVAKIINVEAVTSAIVANSGVAGYDFLYNSNQVANNEARAKEEALAQEVVGNAGQVAGQAAGQALVEDQIGQQGQ